MIYLATPYTLYKDGLDAAARLAEHAAAELMRNGHVVFSPIAHGHAIAKSQGLPNAHEFWMRQCRPFMKAATVLVVVKATGWDESQGIREEILYFDDKDKPILCWNWPGPVPEALRRPVDDIHFDSGFPEVRHA